MQTDRFDFLLWISSVVGLVDTSYNIDSFGNLWPRYFQVKSSVVS